MGEGAGTLATWETGTCMKLPFDLMCIECGNPTQAWI